MKTTNRERSLIGCAVLAFAAVAAFATCVAYGNPWSPGTGAPDTQLWTELDVTGPLLTDTTITGIAKVRLSETLPNPTLTSGEVDLNHRIDGWWLTIGYRHNATPERPEENIDGRNVKISQLVVLFGSRAWDFGRNTLALRLRVDSTINATSNPYVGRVRLEYRWATEGVSWMSSLFANDEVFYEFQDQNWYRNRVRAGANLILTERTGLQVFYQRQDSNNSKPGAINALGLTLDVIFK